MGFSPDRINLWLESVNISNQTIPCRQTRPCALDSIETRKEPRNAAALPSPPGSLKRRLDHNIDSKMADLSTPKKRKLGKDALSALEDDADGLDDTPRANAAASVMGADIPSLSSQTSSVVSGQSSPSRLIDQLRLHPKGGEFRSMNINDQDMPLSLAEFVLDMQRVVKSRVVPAHLEVCLT